MDFPPVAHLSPAQANSLAAIIELEAVWENIPAVAAGASSGDALRGLTAKQRAFDAYRASLVAYNREYRADYHGERPATTPKRLGAWCRRLAGLYRRADGAVCPVQVLEKAHRCADRLAARLGVAACSRLAPASGDAATDLGSIADWCEGLGTGPIAA
jgi:hypothetical protein